MTLARQALKYAAIGALVVGLAYKAGVPPPQRFLDRAQRHELEVYKIRCQDEADAELKKFHVSPSVSFHTLCAEQHYREKHANDSKPTPKASTTRSVTND
jgi:hypothetical protein